MKAISKFREQQGGMTEYQLAKLAGIGRSTLSQADRRSVPQMKVKTIILIAEVFNMTPGEVLDSLLELDEKEK
ncbi:helix-turn-helix domain-containing protein [Listeria kieliensis]